MMTIAEALAGITGAVSIEKKPVCAPRVLNEAYDYELPSSFSRGSRLEFGSVAVTAYFGHSLHWRQWGNVAPGRFPRPNRRNLHNITALLESEGASWKDVVRTTCYLRDIERDYAAFNEERTAFYREQDLHPVPASTGIQAIRCPNCSWKSRG